MLLIPLTYSTAWCLNSTLTDSVKAAWPTYLNESPRDQTSKDFLYFRISSFISNLEKFQNLETSNPATLQFSEAHNAIGRDYQMLESTMRNLPQLDQEFSEARNIGSNLLSAMGNLYGQARHAANSD